MHVLITGVIEWAAAKGIYIHSEADTQLLLAHVELGEAIDEMLKGNHDAAAMELGDTIVCLINWARLEGTYCNLAYIDQLLAGALEVSPIDDLTLTALQAYEALGTNPTGFIKYWLPDFCRHVGATPEVCLLLAYDKIISRTGAMLNGKFVKDSD